MYIEDFLKKRIQIIKQNIERAETKKERKYQEGKLAEAELHFNWVTDREELKGRMDEADHVIDGIIKYFNDLKKDMRQEMFVPDINLRMDASHSIDEFPDDNGFTCGKDNGARSITIDIPPYKRFR